MLKLKRVALVALAMTGLAGAALADGGANGIWKLESGKVTVRIGPCGEALCGVIVGLAKPLNKEGKPKMDKENPDRSLRTRPLMGLTILSNMKPTSDNEWLGTIYNADDGHTYTSRMRLEGNVMKVKGCVGPFCKTKTFNRVN